jgi:hypothetical protein
MGTDEVITVSLHFCSSRMRDPGCLLFAQALIATTPGIFQ